MLKTADVNGWNLYNFGLEISEKLTKLVNQLELDAR